MKTGAATRPLLASRNSGGWKGSAAPSLIALSSAMREAVAAAEDVAVGTTTVLILGESGTGKEVLARHIHLCSPRAAGPWVAVNCAALPGDLLEAELFGHERGAFTGASERRIGRVERAHGGTLLLDEVSELPLPLQAKLLRVLQEREVDRVGGRQPIPVDVRIIATSNRSLKDMMARGEFRADLYYRLDVFPIELSPLRQRPEDLQALSDELLARLARSLGRVAPDLGPEARRALEQYDFPGNVRELANILERALVRCRDAVLDARHLEIPGLSASPAPAPLALTTPASEMTRAGDPTFPPELPVHLPTLERLAIAEALRLEGGNRTHAAKRLGISLRTLRNKLRDGRDDPDGAEIAARQVRPGRPDRAHFPPRQISDAGTALAVVGVKRST
jgi:two-component system response regulator FlrC